MKKCEKMLRLTIQYFRVVFRGWECSHSIRSEILLRYWCPDFFQLLQKIFFRSIQKKVWTFSKKSEIFRFFRDFQKVEIFKENRTFFLWTFSIFLFFLKISNFFENFRLFSNFFLIDRKNIFLKKLKKNPDINIEVKFHCGSNGSTPSLWKPL